MSGYGKYAKERIVRRLVILLLALLAVTFVILIAYRRYMFSPKYWLG